MRSGGQFSHRDRADRRSQPVTMLCRLLELNHYRGVEKATGRSLLVRHEDLPAVRRLRQDRRGVSARSTPGAPRNSARAASAFMNRCLRRGASSPTGVPFLVTTKVSPWSRRRMISPLSFRSSLWCDLSRHCPSVARRATLVMDCPVHRQRRGIRQHFANRLSVAGGRLGRNGSSGSIESPAHRSAAVIQPHSQGGDTGSNPGGAAQETCPSEQVRSHFPVASSSPFSTGSVPFCPMLNARIG